MFVPLYACTKRAAPAVDELGVHFPAHRFGNPLWRGASELRMKSSCPAALWMKPVLPRWGSELQGPHLAVLCRTEKWIPDTKRCHLTASIPDKEKRKKTKQNVAWFQSHTTGFELNNKRLAGDSECRRQLWSSSRFGMSETDIRGYIKCGAKMVESLKVDLSLVNTADNWFFTHGNHNELERQE